MTDQLPELNTNPVSPSLEDILSNKEIVLDNKDTEDKTKAEEPNPTEEPAKEVDSEVEKLRKELETERKRREDTQKWGSSSREATLRIMKSLKDKGLSDEEIAEAVGGKEAFDKILKGVPVDQELNDKNSVVTQVYTQQLQTVAQAMLELGETRENLEEYIQAFDAIAASSPEHKDELYRRATSGEGNVAAYVFKVGKEVIDDYRLSKEVKTKGIKAFKDELREQIRSELKAEMEAAREAVANEVGQTQGKPRLVGGSTPVTPQQESKVSSNLKDIFGI